MTSTGKAVTLFEKIAGFVIIQWGWRAALLALLAGAASAISMPPFDFFPVLFVTLPVLVWLIDGTAEPVDAGFFRRLWPAAKIGWLFGFGYFLAGLWWIGMAFLVDAAEFAIFLPFAVIALPAGLAIYWGLAAAIARIFWVDGWRRIVALAFAIALGEWLRGILFTGLPWNNIGYAALSNPVMMQSASVLGLYGITPLALVVFASPAIFAASSSVRPRRIGALFAIALLLATAHVGYGFWRLSTASDELVENVNIRIVQPAIKQSEKWQEGKEMEIFNRYLSLSARAGKNEGQSLKDVTHLIWPESAFPFLLTRNRAAIASIAALLPKSTTLITGAMRAEPPVPGKSDGFVFNSLYVINGEGEILDAQDKVDLVPFGEYLPFQSLLESIGFRQLTQMRGGFEPGFARRTIPLESAPPFLPLICYEVIFPGQIIGVGERPEWIINLTNDGWFGETPGPYQHLRQAQIRAVEQGIPLVRAANSGISVITDSFGRIKGSLPLGQPGVLDGQLSKALKNTLFTNFGNLPYWLIMLAFFLAITFGKYSVKPKLH